MFKRIILAAALLFIGLSACSRTSVDFQSDADIIRLRHLEYYGNLLDEYHAKTNTYPLFGTADVPIYSFVASPEQYDDIQGGPPYPHKVVDFAVLVTELERILGRELKEYYDPQYAPDYKPNFYIYMVDGNIFNFAVHTHQTYPFSNPVRQGYNKVEITNNTNGSPHLIKTADLLSLNAFKRAKSQKVSKPAFFKAREVKFLAATKASR